MKLSYFRRVAGYFVCGAIVMLSACAIPGMYTGDYSGTAKDHPDGDSAVALPDGTVMNFLPLTASVVAAIPKYVPPIGDASKLDSTQYVYRIGPADILRVTVWDHPELNNPGINNTSGSSGGSSAADIAVATGSNDPLGRVVTAEGTIYFPYVGVLHVAGLTISQVRVALTQRLSSYIKDPQLDVNVSSFRSMRAYVSGEVVKPGVVILGDVPTTVSEIVSSVGGLTVNADLYHATLTRRGKMIPVDLYALLYLGDVSQNYRINPGDMLNIPNNRYNKVFVLGEVIKQSSLVIPKGDYSLTEAIADVGGASQITSNAAQIYVFRRMSDGLTNAYIANLHSPTALALADTFLLKPRDVVFVDPTGMTRFSRIISQVAPFFAGSSNAVNTANIANNLSRE